MDGLGQLLWNIASWVLFVGAVGWFGWHWLRTSRDEPLRLISKWTISVIVLGFAVTKLVPMTTNAATGGPFLAVPLIAACGLVIAGLWTPNIVEVVGRMFGGIYDGGTTEAEAKPLYSQARALIFKSRIPEAVTEIRAQLEKFPEDFEGQMLLAELQAGHLNDLPAAQLTVARLIEQPSRAPGQVAGALTTLAEWHIKFHQDVPTARAELERILERFPGTQFAQIAEQRLASLPSVATVLEPHDRREVRVEDRVVAYEMGKPQAKVAREDSPEEAESKLLDRLEKFPRDTVTREQLAMLYADRFEKLDYATRQFEMLIAMPKQQQRDVVRWLEMIADLQQRFGANPQVVRKTLERIVEKFPKSSAAERAQNRIYRMGG